jgi:antitoxin component YwqK of YwqJK toxin-antitoxin module
MKPPAGRLDIAEIPYEGGGLRFRYSRYLPEGASEWVNHGLFQSYYPNGQISSEGNYEEGNEEGHWREYHANGRLAAEGHYQAGKEHGRWRFWDEEGRPEREVHFSNGQEIEVIENK